MNDKSDTPRTDALYGNDKCVEWEHARQLERELNEAKKALENSKAYKRVMKEENAKLRRELENLKSQNQPN